MIYFEERGNTNHVQTPEIVSALLLTAVSSLFNFSGPIQSDFGMSIIIGNTSLSCYSHNVQVF